MIDFFVKKYIYNKANKLSMPYPQNIEYILNKKIDKEYLNGNHVLFSWLYDCGNPIPNANASFYKLILINSEWAYRLVVYNDEITGNAFRLTLGHELGHKRKHFFRWRHPLYIKFISWVIEVNCDFYAAKIMVSGNRNKLISAIQYKMKNLDIYYSNISHPSWKNRLEYVQKYDFNESLIRRIAYDSCCTNEKLIQSIISFYNDIYLN